MTAQTLRRIQPGRVTPLYRDAAAVSKALSPETPLFCFSRKQLLERARIFLAGFPGQVTYAVKSNPAAEVLEVLAAAGIKSWDVASVHEMGQVRAVSPDAAFNYHNPVKSRREIADAYGLYGCRRFAVDSKEELQKVAEAVGST